MISFLFFENCWKKRHYIHFSNHWFTWSKSLLLMKILKKNEKKCWKSDEFFFELMLMLMSTLKLILSFVISLFKATLMPGSDSALNEEKFASNPSMISEIKSEKIITFHENNIDWLIKNLFIFFVNICAEKNALIITLFILKFSKFSMIFKIFNCFADRIRTMRMIVVVLMINLIILLFKFFCCWNKKILLLIFIMTSFFLQIIKKTMKNDIIKIKMIINDDYVTCFSYVNKFLNDENDEKNCFFEFF